MLLAIIKKYIIFLSKKYYKLSLIAYLKKKPLQNEVTF